LESARVGRWPVLRRGRWLPPKRSHATSPELADFLAAQEAAFADGRAYLEARRKRGRAQL
jgi:hypothetical protein